MSQIIDTQSQTLSSGITVTLRDLIITGQIEQGSRLSETKLAAELQVSRGPLREAIRRLEGMNLIVHKPQQGARVVKLNHKLILEIHGAREALESKCASLAAINMSSAEVDQLHRLIDSQAKVLKASSSGILPAENDYIFHELIIKGSKNSVLKHLLLEEIYHLIKMFRYQRQSVKRSNVNALTEHRHIAYAIEQRDPLLAEVTMRQHIVKARQRLERSATDDH